MTDTPEEVKLEQDIAHDEAKLAALRAQAAADPPLARPTLREQLVAIATNAPLPTPPAEPHRPAWPWGYNAKGEKNIPRDMQPGPHNP